MSETCSTYVKTRNSYRSFTVKYYVKTFSGRPRCNGRIMLKETVGEGSSKKMSFYMFENVVTEKL